MANQDEITRLQEIINNPSSRPAMRTIAQTQLDDLLKQQQPSTALPIGTMSDDDTLRQLLAALQDALVRAGGGNANISDADLRDAVKEELKLLKIDYDDLSDALKSRLQTARRVELILKQPQGLTTISSTNDKMLSRKLTQLILSDYLARNNVYLYGGAGTGKTYMAEYIGGLLGYEVITLNCNQYTSPLDILGGQTIDGYQEGKLSQAWSNVIVNPDGTTRNINGAVLILDELPKIDPNTAGILNEALAKVKDYKEATINGKKELIPPFIRNGRNVKLELGNMFVIATGNVALNTIDPDYEANFKQDLSLQDRFIGSTYKVFVDYRYEAEDIMNGFLFIWIFATRVREAIEEVKATGQAFVSLRLMVNLKETYKVYRSEKKVNTKVGYTALSDPKTIIESFDTFFNLIKESQRQQIVAKVDFDGFKKIVAEKNKMPYNPDAPNFDTEDEQKIAERMIVANEQKRAI